MNIARPDPRKIGCRKTGRLSQATSRGSLGGIVLNTSTATMTDAAIPPGKTGTWWFLASEIPVFGGLIASYIVVRLGSSGWGDASSHFNFTLALINTFLLLTSSMTDRHGASPPLRRTTFDAWRIFSGLDRTLLGSGFLGVKAHRIHRRNQPRLRLQRSGIFWSFYYGMTGLHALHVLAGIIANRGPVDYGAQGQLGATMAIASKLAGLYWHFVDIVWIFLFPLLYLA